MISLFHAFQGMDEPRAVVTLDHHIAAIKYLVKGDDDHAPDPFPKGKAIENGDEKDPVYQLRDTGLFDHQRQRVLQIVAYFLLGNYLREDFAHIQNLILPFPHSELFINPSVILKLQRFIRKNIGVDP